jgi:TrmH family RNA methyltransferase
MDEAQIITSTQNPRVKALAKLAKRRERDEAGLFIIEGPRPVERAFAKGIEFPDVYICPEFFGSTGSEPELVQKFSAAGVPVIQLSKEAFQKAAYREHPEGILAVAKQWQTSLSSLQLSDNPFLIVLEAVEKPGNLGAILRTADAVSADGVIIADAATDIYNPNVVRASTGTLFSVPIAVTNTTEAIEFLRHKGIRTVAATPHTETNYSTADLTGPIAIVMGSEDEGLTDAWLKACDVSVKLPMLGVADSLNVSATTVVLAYEALRQRELKK